jgi:exodeoxyribonuclease VII small subunit
MPMKNSRKAAAKEGEKGPSFEQAIQRLEKIVAEMEAAELPLEDILKKYEEGSRLVRFCSQKLEEAEQKIELLTKRNDGTVVLKPFEPDREGESDESAGEHPEDNEAKLF